MKIKLQAKDTCMLTSGENHMSPAEKEKPGQMENTINFLYILLQ